jgi:catechol 2,3-dioxygenase-like lactoylglutathione lyase family enzyme
MHVAVSRDLWFNLHRIACGRGQPGRVEVREREGYVPVHFNHLAVAAKDKQQSARFLKDLLGLPEPTSWGPFCSLTLDDGIRLDYAELGVEFPGQHYALLVSDDVFDRAVERIKANGVPFWAGPGHTPGEINTNHGGRGVYFDDPAGHHFELITQPYGPSPAAPQRLPEKCSVSRRAAC